MQMTVREIAQELRCSDRSMYLYLHNWRFCKYRVPVKPLSFEVNTSFISDMNDFLLSQRHFATRNLTKKLGNLYKLVTPLAD